MQFCVFKTQLHSLRHPTVVQTGACVQHLRVDKHKEVAKRKFWMSRL